MKQGDLITGPNVRFLTEPPLTVRPQRSATWPDPTARLRSDPARRTRPVPSPRRAAVLGEERDSGRRPAGVEEDSQSLFLPMSLKAEFKNFR